MAQTSAITGYQTVSLLQNGLNLQSHTVSRFFQQLLTMEKLDGPYYQALVIGVQ